MTSDGDDRDDPIGAETPPVSSTGGGSDDGGGWRPGWLVPAAGGLVAGLVVSLGVVALFGGDDADAPVATEVTTTIAPETTLEPVPETTVDTTIAPETTVVPDTTAVPETTVAPDTTAPPDPATTLSPDGIPTARDGFVRILDEEYPIIRVCASSPMAGFGIQSFAYEATPGFVDYVEWYTDEGSTGGGFAGDAYPIDDFGDDGFGMIAFQGDGGFPVSVNPADDMGSGDCGSVTITDPTNPDFPATYAIVDVCLGSVFATVQQGDGSFDFQEAFGYRAQTAEYGSFTALPGANGETFAVDYNAPLASFGGFDPAAAGFTGADRLVITATVVGSDAGAYAGQSRLLEATILDSEVRTCPEV